MTKLKKGSRIGPFPYRVIKPLNSQGGMSDVYLATEAAHGDLDSGPKVVLKIARVHKNHHEFYEDTIYNEAERLRKFHHRGVVHILPVSTDSRMPNQTYAARTSLTGAPWFLVLEHLQGGSVDELLQKHARLPLGLAVTIVLETAKTLQFLHEQEQVHLDIKPENILLRRPLATGAAVEPVLIDFGVARDIGQEGLEARTLPYAPPERVEVYKENRPPETIAKPHPSMDIYSLGVVFYQMLTGRRPFVGRSNKKLSSAILESKVTPPSKFVSGLPPEVDELGLALLHRDPTQRPTAKDLVQQLEQLHSKKELSAKLQPHWEQFRPTRQPSFSLRNLTFGAATIALLIGFALAMRIFVQWSDQPTPTPTTVAVAAVQPTPLPILRTPTSTATPTPMPTPTPKRKATSTSVQLATPTRTATRVITPTLSVTAKSALPGRAIKTPTPTPTTAAPTRRAKSTPMALPTKTQTATPAPTNTLAPPPKVTNPLPVAPATPTTANSGPTIDNGGPTRLTAFGPDSGITGDGSLTFSWSADAPLAAGQVFELVFWRDGQSYTDGRAWNEASTANTASLKVSVQPAGSYYWGVWLAHHQPYQRIRYLGGGNRLVVKGTDDNNSSNSLSNSNDGAGK